MVAAQCAVTGRQRCAAHVGQLLGMQFDGQAQRLGGLEHLLGFGQREADALAKHVHGIDQALSGQGGQHLVAHQVDVSLAASGVFGGQGVCTQEGSAHGHAKQLPQAAGHAQLLAFMRQRQAVARLDFDGTHAFVQQCLQTRGGLGQQRVLGGLARGLD